LAFGAISFELLADEAAHARLAGWEPRFSMPHDDPRARAHALCAVTIDPSLASRPGLLGPLRFTRDDGGRIAIDSDAIAAVVERTAPARYAVSARIADTEHGPLALMRGVSAAIVQEEGGAVLHAAAAELDGRAWLYVGPSGAGKSTAVCLTEGGRCFAFDHVAIMPAADGATAWGLPGGRPAAAPLAASVVYPIAALLRVRRRPCLAAPQLEPARGADRLFILRESLECAELSSGAEDRYLATVAQLAELLPIGVLNTVLGQPHSALLRAFAPRPSAKDGQG
jgi:hypothetical protein